MRSPSRTSPSAGGVRWDDPAFGIDWPEAEERVMSEQDRSWPDFDLRSQQLVEVVRAWKERAAQPVGLARGELERRAGDASAGSSASRPTRCGNQPRSSWSSSSRSVIAVFT